MKVKLSILLLLLSAVGLTAQEETKEVRSIQVTVFGNFGMNSTDYANNFSWNILYGFNGGVQGAEIGTILNYNDGDVAAFQIGGISNITEGDVTGFQFGGITNITRGDVTGYQFGGIVNDTEGDFSGFQLGGIGNYTTGTSRGLVVAGISNISSDTVSGIGIAGISNFSFAPMEGLFGSGIAAFTTESITGGSISGISNFSLGNQTGAFFAGIANYSHGSAKGFQVAGIGNASAGSMKGAFMAPITNFALSESSGFQLSLANIVVGDFSGLQLGLLNGSDHLKGVQIGLVNYSGNADSGVPIGMVSIVKDGLYQFELTGGEVLYSSFNYKMGVDHFYTLYKAGFSWYKDSPVYSLGLGFGSSFSISENQAISLDLSANHIIYETFYDKLNLLLKADLNYHHYINENISLMVGPSFNMYLTKQTADGEYGTINIPYTFYSSDISDGQISMWVGLNGGFSYRI